MKAPRKKFNFTLLILDDLGKVRRVRLTERRLLQSLALLTLAGALLLWLLASFFGGRARLNDPETGPEASRTQAGQSLAGLTLGAKTLETLQQRILALAPIERFFAPPGSRRLSIPDQWPLRGWATSEFGRRPNPFTGEAEMHTGLDIAASIGSDVIAPAAGIVLYTGEKPGYGNYLILLHGHGLTTHYGHLSHVIASLGQEVKAGEVVARSGNSGQSTGPHLHYEVRLHNLPVDPRRYLPATAAPQQETATIVEPTPPLLDVPEPATPPPAPTGPPPLIDVPEPSTPEPAPAFSN